MINYMNKNKSFGNIFFHCLQFMKVKINFSDDLFRIKQKIYSSTLKGVREVNTLNISVTI